MLIKPHHHRHRHRHHHHHRNRNMEQPEQHNQPNPWFIKHLSQQSDIISDCLLSLTSPFLSLFSLVATKQTDDPAGPTAADRCRILMKKAAKGFVGAAYVGLILMMLMAVSVFFGVGLVRLWLEEPVRIQEKLYFDYTNANPSAVLDLGFGGYGKGVKGVPVGHVCNVRLVLVMPESDYNREIGMFQVVAESFSSNGDVITSSSYPYMLRFRSPPIRAMQTFLRSAPLVLGIKNEVQTVNLPLLKYKEHHFPRTQSIRISFVPRAGLPFLPQLYEARLIATSELPWRKRLVRNWKWTFYVWTSLYIYLMLLLVLICWFRSIMFPTTVSGYQRLAVSDVLTEEPTPLVGERERPTSENLKRWRQSRSKRKATLLGGGFPETTVGSEATSMSVKRDEDASVTTEEVGDSESICQ